MWEEDSRAVLRSTEPLSELGEGLSTHQYSRRHRETDCSSCCWRGVKAEALNTSGRCAGDGQHGAASQLCSFSFSQFLLADKFLPT